MAEGAQVVGREPARAAKVRGRPLHATSFTAAPASCRSCAIQPKPAPESIDEAFADFTPPSREVEPQDFSGNLIVQLGTVTEPLNRHWYEQNTGQVVTEVQRQVFHPVKRWMAATLDGMVEGTGAVFEAKFMLPWSFSEDAAAEKHMAQLQHNMRVTGAAASALSITVFSSEVACTEMFSAKNRASAT